MNTSATAIAWSSKGANGAQTLTACAWRLKSRACTPLRNQMESSKETAAVGPAGGAALHGVW